MEPNEAQDQILTCVDCGVQFPFSGKDQAFYKERGFLAPRRCKNCRQKRKAGGPGGGGAGGGGSGNWAGGGGGGYGSGGAGHGYGGGGAPRDANRPAREFFKVVCSSCGTETSVPFKPDSSRPVYCRNCFQNRKKSGEI